jgi:hypothetical protein
MEKCGTSKPPQCRVQGHMDANDIIWARLKCDQGSILFQHIQARSARTHPLVCGATISTATVYLGGKPQLVLF